MEFSFRSVGNVDILTISGSLDHKTVAPIRSWFETQISCEPAYLVVNLKGANYLDSVGLATLVAGLNRTRKLKGDLRLCCLPGHIRMLLELTRLYKVFEIYPTEDAAIQAFSAIQVAR